MGRHVVLAIGTRPELIKLAPLAHALHAEGIRTTLLLSGQHSGLDLRAFNLDLFTAVHLDVLLAGLEPPAMVDAIAAAMRPAVRTLAPDAVVVQGDTSTALAGARAADTIGLPVAHVEAGLRSGDPAMPWPEEPFRIEIDRRATWLFAPTAGARANLHNEGVTGRVFVTGNTGIDALRLAIVRAGHVACRSGPPLILLTAHRRENLGAGMAGIARGLKDTAGHVPFRLLVLAHPRPHTAGLQRRAFAGLPRTRVLPPQTPAATLALMRRATVILSDSGGISEEATTLGRPLLILRERTERPEAVAAGAAVLVGNDPARITTALVELLTDGALQAARAQPRPVFGDGHAAPRIAAILRDALGARLDASVRAA